MSGPLMTDSPLAHRAAFLADMARETDTLEIGPFDAPIVTGPEVRYFDVLDQQGLQTRAAKLNRKPAGVPHIDYVSATGDLGIVDRKFKAVVSAHAIEHQPDLVKHLSDVAGLLEDGGRYYLLIPDKRYCFDHFIAESTVADVYQAHVEGRDRHLLKSVIEHRALTTHNDALRHWAGDHSNGSYLASIPARTKAAIAEYEAANGGYVDVHAWQFTPPSFLRLIEQLSALDAINLVPEAVYETPYNRLEFMAVLRKP